MDNSPLDTYGRREGTRGTGVEQWFLKDVHYLIPGIILSYYLAWQKDFANVIMDLGMGRLS